MEERTRAMQFGQAVQARRQAMEMSLNVLSREMGGSPGASFLSKLESGQVPATARVASKLASSLNLPVETLLNAAGHASETQRAKAIAALREMVGAPAPVVMTIPVMEVNNPDAIGSGGRRQRLVRQRDDYFIVDLTGKENEPFVGEVLASLTKEPEEGDGVVVTINDRASAWTYHDPGKPVGPHIENAAGEKRAKNYTILGVITRVVSERNFG